MSKETILPDGSAFFVAEIDMNTKPVDPISWNPYNKVVHDHRDGSVMQPDTDNERNKRGLPTPWTPEMADKECHELPIA